MKVMTKITYRLYLYVINFFDRIRLIARPARRQIQSQLRTKIIMQLTIDKILNKQFKEASRKNKTPHHWGDTGLKIEAAAAKSALIVEWCDDKDPESYFKRVLPAMAALANAYRMDCNDEDGYALGTVREIEDVILDKARYFEQAP